MTAKGRAPRGLQESGRRLWRSVVDAFDEVDEHEKALLTRACRVLDTIDGLQAIVDDEGLITDSSQGRRANPALVELRQQELLLARLMTTLRLDFGAQIAVAPQRDRTTKLGVVKGA